MTAFAGATLRVMTIAAMLLVVSGSNPLVHKMKATNNRARPAAWNDRPIIGVVAQDSKSRPGKTWISSTYVKYLEQAGARVVPVRGNQEPDYYKKIVDYTNGLLFPGGAVSFVTSQFARSVRMLWARAMQLNMGGDYYPIWGTCMGFQILCNLTVGANLLRATDSSNASWPLDFAPASTSSRLFGQAPADILQILQKENVTQNEHSYSILLKVFDETPALFRFFKKLSTNKDRVGKEFISTVEAWKYPVYGTQWHPEKNNFNWRPGYVINHSPHAVRISQYMANFFVYEARRNKHHFPDPKSEASNMIQNYPMVYTPELYSGIYYIS